MALKTMHVQMKLVRRSSGTYAGTGKEYFRWDVSIPADLVEELGWKAGDELEATRVKDTIVLRRAK